MNSTLLRAGAASCLLAVLALFAASAAAQSSPFTCPPAAASQLPYGVGLLNLPAAWQRACGTASVAVIDNGVPFDVVTKRTHDQLQSNVRLRFSRRFGPLADETPAFIANLGEGGIGAGSFGHGTHVAGIIGATPLPAYNNAVGACPSCSLIILPGQKLDGRAIVRAYESGAQVINFSSGTNQSLRPPGNLPAGTCAYAGPELTDINHLHEPTYYSQSFCDALTEASRRDIVIVGASGNERLGTINFPASRVDAIAVGGIDSSSGFWVGETMYELGTPTISTQFGSNFGTEQSVVAPAREVYSLFTPQGTWHQWLTLPPGKPADALQNCQDISTNGIGYGRCTGTSQSAPYVSGIVALIRSANPLLSAAEVRAILTQRSSNAASHSDQMGYGIPNASNSVVAALVGLKNGEPLAPHSGVRNRWTPLLGLHSPEAKDHVYTVVPQAAAAAHLGTLPPRPAVRFLPSGWEGRCTDDPARHCGPSQASGVDVAFTVTDSQGDAVAGVFVLVQVIKVLETGEETIWDPTQTPISGPDGAITVHVNYFSAGSLLHRIRLQTIAEERVPFDYIGATASSVRIPIPGCDFPPFGPGGCIGLEVASVFATHVNPLDGSTLSPLYRLSWKCGEPGFQGTCSANPGHTRHFYTTDSSRVASLQSEGYQLDGIEGFIYPKTVTQPEGTLKLCRKYSPTNDDYVLFIEDGSVGGCSANSDGYTRMIGGANDNSYTGLVDGTDWIGYAHQVQSPRPEYAPGTAPAYSIVTVTNSSASAVVGTAYAPATIRTFLNANFQPAAGVTVTFTTPGSGPSASSATHTVITDSQGYATVTFTANTIAGSFDVIASTSTVATSFHFTNLAGAPASIAALAPTSQSGPAYLLFSSPLQVLVRDAYSNLVPNASVAFTAPASGPSATFSANPAATNSGGVALVYATANNMPGSYTVSATAGGSAGTVTFSLTNLPAFDNASFEIPNVAYYTQTSNFAAWTLTGCGAIMENNGLAQAGLPLSPSGLQVGYYCSDATLRQSIQLNPGAYYVTYKTMGRNFTGNFVTETVGVSGPGVSQSYTMTPPSSAWTTYNSPVFQVTGGTYSFVWSSSPAIWGYVYLDDVKIVKVNAPPAVNLTSPVTGQVYAQGSGISLSATASDLDGTIQDVKFYDGASLIATVPSPSGGAYTAAWSTMVRGNHAITARATDNNAVVTTSAVANINIVCPANPPPMIGITSPFANQAYNSLATISIAVSASDPDGVAKVEFFQNGVKLGESTSAPYAFTWAGVPPGTYSITATATDGCGNVATSAAVPVIVVAPAQFLNPGFESPNLVWNTTAPITQGWTIAGCGAMAENVGMQSSGLPASPQGLQAGFYCSDATLSQTLFLVPGSYRVSFFTMGRNFTASSVTGKLTVSGPSGTQIWNWTPPASAWMAYTTPSFTITTAGLHQFAFASNPAVWGYVYLDNVQLLSP